MGEKFTAGPWEFWGGDHAPILHIYATDGKHLFHDCRGLEEQQANARLMAAAPQLLGALENLFIHVGMGWELDDVLKDAEAALKAARAEA